jgi:hypothetical protein
MDSTLWMLLAIFIGNVLLNIFVIFVFYFIRFIV